MPDRADSQLGAQRPFPDFDWYEHISDSTLQKALCRDPESTFGHLAQVLGQAEAREVVEDLTAISEEGLFTPELDPNLPEIIYLHGIMGGHLANHYGAGERVWLNSLALVAGNVAERMTLRADGLSEIDDRYRLGPDGHIRVIYAKAARKWRKAGFAVHEVAYDWRKPVGTAADQLHGQIEQLTAGNPNRRFVVVAHSMGGLVASLYAARHPEWDERVQRAVFIGSPLGGSYAPIEAVLGVYPFLRALRWMSRQDDMTDLRVLSAAMPGLIQMLPNPELFADPLDYYATPVWPDGPKPLQRWLNASRNGKTTILRSPLLERTIGIVSREHGTVASIDVDHDGRIKAGPRSGPGDGTVPIAAAALPQLMKVYEARGERHATLLWEPDVIEAVTDLLKRGTTEALPTLDLLDIDYDIQLPVLAIAETPDTESTAIQQRMELGQLTAADIRWLCDPVVGAPAA